MQEQRRWKIFAFVDFKAILNRREVFRNFLELRNIKSNFDSIFGMFRWLRFRQYIVCMGSEKFMSELKKFYLKSDFVKWFFFDIMKNLRFCKNISIIFLIRLIKHQSFKVFFGNLSRKFPFHFSCLSALYCILNFHFLSFDLLTAPIDRIQATFVGFSGHCYLITPCISSLL